MENPKILVGAPCYYAMDYCIKEFIESLQELDYDNYDILIVDNSRGNEFFDKLEKDFDQEKIILIKDDTSEEINKLRLVSSRNIILNYALENNYDYVLMMDSDVIAPKTIIKDLLENNKDIVSGIYNNYFVIDGEQKLRPVAWCYITPEEFEAISKKTNFPPSVKSHKDLRRHLTEEEVKSGKLIRVKFPSAGCMLLKRRVFEKIKYGLLDLPGGKKSGDDIYFCTKAEEEGFEVYCNTKVKCEHLIFGKFYKDKDGNLRNPLFD